MNEAFKEAAIEQWTWKTDAMKAMTLAVCRLALQNAECGARSAEFSANDLEDFNHGGTGICGTVFGRLAKDGVLAPVGAFVGGEFQQKTVKNAGGNMIRVWRLKNGALARRAIELHGGPVASLKQGVLLEV